MGEYKEAEFYEDEWWMGVKAYSPPFVRGGYVFAWVRRFRHVASKIAPNEEIFDVGCGSGVLAAVMWHEFKHRARYTGIDFCEPLIERAKEGNRREGHQNSHFVRGDARDLEILLGFLKEIRTIICTEVLEHLEDDLALIGQIPPGVRCVLTVPCYDDPAHLRWFPELEDIHERYGEFFDGFEVERFYSDHSRKLRVDRYDNLMVGVKK